MNYLTTKCSCWQAWLAVLAMTVSISIHAAPGTLSQVPLFTSTNNVQPNIFFELDDSGSMDWEILTNPFWQRCIYDNDTCRTRVKTETGNFIGMWNNVATEFTYIHNNTDNIYPQTQYASLRYGTDSTLIRNALDYDWRPFSSSFNFLYYNPNTTYLPWQTGGGALMQNADFTAARSNPASTVAGYNVITNLGTLDKTSTYTGGFVFEVWTDSHGFNAADLHPIAGKNKTTVISNRTDVGNGIVDYWDNHRRYTITNDSISYQDFSCNVYNPVNHTSDPVTLTCTGGSVVTATSGPTGRTLAAEQQNIANWYQYYRRRSFVAKAALAKVVSENPDYQYGLSVINCPKSNSNCPSSLFTPISGNNGSTLITNLFGYQWPKQGTPLRVGLDNVGKYFQGLPSNAGSYTSPITSKCQQNFAIVFTDGYWGVDTSTVVGDRDLDGIQNTLADVAKYYYDTDLSSFADAVPTSKFDPNNKQHLVTFTIAFGLQGKLIAGSDGWPIKDTDGKSPVIENSNWGVLDPKGTQDVPEKLDDLWHTAYNSKGTFLSASSPEAVSQGFANILASIGGRGGGSASSVAFNTNTLTSTTAVYLAQFKSPDASKTSTQPDWIGDLKSFSLNASTGEVSGQAWSAAEKLLSQSDTSRKIFTYNRETNKGIAFQWVNLADNQKKDLLTNTDSSIGSDISKGQARLAYLRGSRANEGTGDGTFKKRSQLLSDIVHSDPLFVGRPRGNWPAAAPFTTNCSQTYETFKTAKVNRAKVVYVGTNDGMLHGFAASNSAGSGYGDGSELMAYIPNSLFSSGNAVTGLHYLTDPNYTHRYYVDLPATLGDVCIDTSVTASKGTNKTWHSVVLGGLMAGGRGIFALDVTDPSSTSFSETNANKIVLWEFDNSDDADMGYSFAKPTIAMMENGRWAAVFGNGYNATGVNSTGNAALFILFLDGGLDGIWTKDEDYIKIAAPTSADKVAGNDCINSGSNCNGLSSPQLVDINRDYKMDRAYAGDVRGNLWAFDLSDTDPKNWKVAYNSTASKPVPLPLFTASHHITPTSPTTGTVKTAEQQKLCAGLPCVQQITSKPLVAVNPVISATQPNVLIFFGTGQYLIDSDLTSKNVQSFYGVWDHGIAELTPANLIEQTFLTGPFSNAGVVNTKVRVLSSNPVNYDRDNKTTNQGWFVNLSLANGERVVVDPDLRVVDNSNTQNNDLIFFNTWIPEAAECSAGGSGFLMSVDMTTGGNPKGAAFDLNGTGGVNDSDKVVTKDGVTMGVSGIAFEKGLPSSSTFLDDRRYTPGTDGGDKITTDQVITGPPMRRISWQELRNN